MRDDTYWVGEPPSNCDLCGASITEEFVDGKTQAGPWAIMCPACHVLQGGQLASGVGQQYKRNGDKFVKVA